MFDLCKVSLLAVAAGMFFSSADLYAGPNLRARMSLYLLAHNQEPDIAATQFVEVKPGAVRFCHITLENTGDSTLNFTAPTALLGTGASRFSVVVDRPPSILAGQSAQLVVKYQPDVEGEHEATLSLTSNAPVPLFSVNFLGSCTNVPSIHMSDLSIQNASKLKVKCNNSLLCKASAKMEIVNQSLVEADSPGMYLWVADTNGFVGQHTSIIGVKSKKRAKARKSFADPPKVTKGKMKLQVPPGYSKFVVFLWPDNGDVQLKDNYLALDFPI